MPRIFFLISYSFVALIISSTLVFSSFAIPVPKIEAGGGLGGQSTLGLQIKQQAELSLSALKNTLTAANTSLTAGATTGLFLKENLLDGIGWAIAKQMVSSMTRSLINWINSGFQGSPAFITDLKAHLLNALDSVAGEYIKSLGGIGEFICSPFKLDVQAALQINYQQQRSGMPSGPTACTLSGVKDNIENFMQGTMSGWDQWFKVTSNPQNTPYGAYLEAEAKLNAKLVNEAGREIEVARWGDGFMSKKVCKGGGAGEGAKKCTITTPGKVISEALTFQLSTGPRSLIEADEINELIGALMNQLVQQAMQGINGLLGLGGNSQYTDYNYGNGTSSTSYLDALANESALNSENLKIEIDKQLALEIDYSKLIQATIEITSIKLGLSSSSPTSSIAIDENVFIVDTNNDHRVNLSEVVNTNKEASLALPAVIENIATLNLITIEYNNAENATSSDQTADSVKQKLVLQYADLVKTNSLSSPNLIEANRVKWSRVVMNLP